MLFGIWFAGRENTTLKTMDVLGNCKLKKAVISFGAVDSSIAPKFVSSDGPPRIFPSQKIAIRINHI